MIANLILSYESAAINISNPRQVRLKNLLRLKKNYSYS